MTYQVTRNGVVIATDLTAGQLMASDYPSDEECEITEERAVDTTAIESLRAFAIEHSEIQFAHLCTAALAGEGWAVERIGNSLAAMHAMSDGRGYTDLLKLGVIRNTDTARPDSAIARSGIEV